MLPGIVLPDIYVCLIWIQRK